MGRLLAALLLTFVAAEAGACSCWAAPPVDIAVRNADAVFAGVVVSIEDQPAERNRKVTFRVLQWWKNDIPAEMIELWTGYGGGDCGYPVEEGASYLVFGARNAYDLLMFSICDRTAALICATKDLEELGEPVKTYERIDMRSIIEREQPYTAYGRPCIEAAVLVGKRGLLMDKHCRFMVDGVIGRDGWVRDFRIVLNGSPDICPISLERVIEDRVAGWQFRPAKLNGEPVETRLTHISMREPVTEAEAGGGCVQP